MGGISPLLLTSLLGEEKCVEKFPNGCTQPTTANASPTGTNYATLCGDTDTSGCGTGYIWSGEMIRQHYCCPCCTCPDTQNAGSGTCEMLGA